MTDPEDVGTDEMPQPLMRGVTSNPTMGALVFEFERENADERYAKWAGADEGFERVLGFFIPPFQRPAVWTPEQNVAFVENAWRGVHLGTYVVNRKDEYDAATERWNRLDRWLIDGQQRLRAIQSYLRSEFPVFGRTWAQLSELEHRRFENYEFAKTMITESDEGRLRFLYDCLNFGGTAHTEDQRATVPAPSGAAAPAERGKAGR
jgi:hypothetical protein